MYLDVSENPEEDLSALHNKIEDLQNQVFVNESIIKNLSEENQKLKSKIEGLR